MYGSDREGNHINVGTFHPMLGDALTQISESCPNAVTQTSNIYKSEIQVYWKAPPSGNGCVTFRYDYITVFIFIAFKFDNRYNEGRKSGKL